MTKHGGSMAKNHCPHVWGAGRIHIEEETVRVSRSSFRHGKVVAMSEDARDFNGPGKFTIRCEECGFKHTYNLLSPRLPRWVTTLLIEHLDRMKERARAGATWEDVFSASRGVTISALTVQSSIVTPSGHHTTTAAQPETRGAMSQ
jgi:hypothetical protein